MVAVDSTACGGGAFACDGIAGLRTKDLGSAKYAAVEVAAVEVAAGLRTKDLGCAKYAAVEVAAGLRTKDLGSAKYAAGPEGHRMPGAE